MGTVQACAGGFAEDLVIVVRKGNGKVVQTTVGDTPMLHGFPPVSWSTTPPTRTTTRAGGRWGDPGANDPSSARSEPSHSPTASKPALRRICSSSIAGRRMIQACLPSRLRRSGGIQGSNVLEAPSVPAVEAFHKLVVESEKHWPHIPSGTSVEILLCTRYVWGRYTPRVSVVDGRYIPSRDGPPL